MTAAQFSGTRLFVDQARNNFGDVGAVAPSSPSLARAMVAPLDRYRSQRTVLKVGAGTGAVTAALIDRLAPVDRLDVVESNGSFAQALPTVTEVSTMTTRPYRRRSLESVVQVESSGQPHPSPTGVNPRSLSKQVWATCNTLTDRIVHL